MGFLDELKRLTHPYEDEMEDDYDEEEDVYEEEDEPEEAAPPPPPPPALPFGKNRPAAGNTRSRPAVTPAKW